MKRNWLCGIDLGSSEIRGVIGRVEGATLSLFGAASVESGGLAKGVVTDLESFSSAVKELVERLEFETKLRLEGTLLALNGLHLECREVIGKGFVSEEGREITARDIRQTLHEAQWISFPMNRRLLHALLQGYVVDGQEGIRNPIGMYAHRLGVQLKWITGVASFVQNAVTGVNRAGLEVEGLVLSGYATALAAVESELRERKALFLEIGEEISTFLVFQNGGISHVKLLPVGGTLLTETIARTFEIPFREAETLKRQYGTLFLPERAKQHELLVSDGSAQKVVLRKELCDVVQKGVYQLFEIFRKELEPFLDARSPLILAGGASVLEGLVEEAGSFFRCETRLGSFQKTRAPRALPFPFATPCGLIWYGHQKQKEEKTLQAESPAERVLTRMKTLFQDYF